MAHFRLAGLIATLLGLAIAVPAQPAYKYIRVGNEKDANVTPRAGYALMGGGKDLDEAFQWLCGRAPGGDFLILRATGTDAYNSYIQGLCKLNSVATLIVPARAAATDPFVAKTISGASVIFIAGGDQANYIDFWMGTPVQTALNDAIKRGVPIGGTSAGLAVMGEYAYSAQGDQPDDKDLDSKTVLADPFNPRVTLVPGFLTIPALQNMIADSHFVKRDRIGRLIGFLARLNTEDKRPLDERRTGIRGIGIDERTAILLRSDGAGIVVGKGSAYLVQLDVDPVLARGKPLTQREVWVQKLVPDDTVDLYSWQGGKTRYMLSVESGALRSSGGVVY
jgi:cyanophycinase